VLIEMLAEYGLFFAKVATFVVAVLLVIVAVASASQRGADNEGHLEVKKINDRLSRMEDTLRAAVLDEHALKRHDKVEKQRLKQRDKEAKRCSAADVPSRSVYVLDFDGDMKASAAESFREEVTAVLTLASANDEVVVRLESPGGMVHAYGFASSQLVRFKTAKVPLTVCVDKVAASGGYMMACIADKLLAAPFAVIGSIGVVASLPNFNRVLKKHDVDYELLTAGEYKRTLTMLGENTEAGRNKFIEDLQETHDLFKEFVAEYRPQLDIAEVATGETWYGKKAQEKALVDGISTSDEYITGQAAEASIYEVKFVQKKNWQEKLGLAAQAAIENSLGKLWSATSQHWNSKH